MSLYEGMNVDVKVGNSGFDASNSKGNTWSHSGLRLLHDQVKLKKAALTQRDRLKSSAPLPSTSVTPVIDLSSRKRKDVGDFSKPTEPSKPSLLKVRRPLPMDGAPLSFLPYSAKEDKVNMFGEICIEDEYNPLVPNEYDKVKIKLECDAAKLRAEEKAKKVLERDRKLLEKDHELQLEDQRKESMKRIQGAAIAPPQTLVEQDKQILEAPVPESSLNKPPISSVLKGLGVAAKIMEKYGYKAGGGLGREMQGMSTALQVERVGPKTGKIIHEKHNLVKEYEDTDSNSPIMAPPPDPDPVPITQVLKNPTKVVMLRNMVGPTEVDDDLEPEIKEEMVKYGEVARVMIFQMPPPIPENEAIRIFVEFPKVDQAIKAVVDLNGRYFGGRQVRAGFYDPDRFKQFELNVDVDV